MAGAQLRVDYTSDTGAVYTTKIPQWAATLLGVSGGSSTAQLPTGLRPRRRYVKVTATGKEHSFVVPDIGATNWTAAMGTAVILPLFGVVTPGSANATLEGRTGERTKHL